MRLAPVVSAALVAAVALGACAAAPVAGSPTVFDGQASGRLGETVRIGDVLIRPLEVIEDSRCPEDVDCVWAGRFVVRVEIRTDHEQRTEDMELRQGIALEDARRLALDEVSPGRRHQPPQNTGPYHLTFTLGPGD